MSTKIIGGVQGPCNRRDLRPCQQINSCQYSTSLSGPTPAGVGAGAERSEQGCTSRPVIGRWRAMAKHTIRVVAAVVERDGRYLITQRRESAVLPMRWEFPGGKVEAGES